MGKSIAVIQSNYIPWKGYFDIINTVDEFVLYDDAQYTKRDWRNRNVIKTTNGLHWLSIPVEVKGKYFQKIRDTKIADKKWAVKHWDTIKQNYRKAPFFHLYKEFFEDLYLNSNECFLSDVNLKFILAINQLMKIETEVKWSSDYNISVGKNQKLIDICKQSGATVYYSGVAAQEYMDEAMFEKEGISVMYADYSKYKEYQQLYPPFEHKVSILDLFFNVGDKTMSHIVSDC